MNLDVQGDLGKVLTTKEIDAIRHTITPIERVKNSYPFDHRPITADRACSAIRPIYTECINKIR